MANRLELGMISSTWAGTKVGLEEGIRRTAEIGFDTYDVFEDPVGTLVARNRPVGEPAFGVGSHCDSNRNGGKYDGTMGVVTALEVCRLNAELGLDLPLQLISFLEEEGSGFGQMLLGSRIMLERVTEEELRETFRAIDDGRSFWEHAEEAGYEPARWRECGRALDDLTGWIEMHIEQARVLQDTGNRVGIVNAIAGYVHADVRIRGRGDRPCDPADRWPRLVGCLPSGMRTIGRSPTRSSTRPAPSTTSSNGRGCLTPSGCWVRSRTRPRSASGSPRSRARRRRS